MSSRRLDLSCNDRISSRSPKKVPLAISVHQVSDILQDCYPSGLSLKLTIFVENNLVLRSNDEYQLATANKNGFIKW